MDEPKVANSLPTPPESDHDSSSDTISYRSADHIDIPLPPESSPPTDVLDIDSKTPDGWLPRDPRLIRLTGVHPFNVEPPLTDLFNQGFLTSPELFYVRNHGHVPRVEDDAVLDWELSVEGMVHHPFKITIRELLDRFEQKTYPITLVCAGNRRKEQNVVRKSKGFSWGAAGLSTALFTGVTLADLLQAARPARGARYVCMEGADKLPNGVYGTSIKLNWAMDPNRGIMIAHGMNGEMLRPDHGKPLRAVVPGQIGGRSVKWLKRLIVTAEPSDNWYHIYDNRVLPTMVSPEESAQGPRWWTDERYAIYDLSTNSAIAVPANNETLSLDRPVRDYTIRGYAYGGGGRRVTRCEITIDQGRSWRLAEIDYAEDRYRDAGPMQLCGGRLDMEWRETSFCWCFWRINISIDELAEAKDICVRAMDESMNVQPRDMYWSVLGMMNNPWFRIAIIREQDCLRFEHPTMPAMMTGGWMERVKQAGGDLTNGIWGEHLHERDGSVGATAEPVQEIVMTKPSVRRTITIDELRQHESELAPWFVLRGEVYDGTSFLREHPGGAQSIISAAGLDVTEEFMAIRKSFSTQVIERVPRSADSQIDGETAKAMMPDYHVGTLDDAARTALSGQKIDSAVDETSSVFLDARRWKGATLHSKTVVSWDSRVLRFKLGHDRQVLGLPIGQHLMIRLRDSTDKQSIIRSYTPISEPNSQGYVDILVKVYFAGGGRQGGQMSTALDCLTNGEMVDMKGPVGKFEYLGRGRCAVHRTERHVKTFVMICAGSGITPIYQVLRAAMGDPQDETQCVVINGNRLQEDILCKTELDTLARGNEQRCQLLYTLTQASEDWSGLRGRITTELLQRHADRGRHKPGKALALICGPEGLEKSVHAILLKLGWQEDELVFF